MYLLLAFLLATGSHEPTIFYYNGHYYYDENYWYGPGWYYGRWYGSAEPYWIWRRRHPHWWNRVQRLREWDKAQKSKTSSHAEMNHRPSAGEGAVVQFDSPIEASE